jgi:uncharacterized protein with GYD domain
MSAAITPAEVLSDLFGEEDFVAIIMAVDDEAAAKLAIRRLIDAGFVVVPIERAQP